MTELTLQTLSNAKVYTDVFASINAHSTEHVSLPTWADCMVVAPATANVLAKMAYGVADDALTTTFCAMSKPVVIAPAMNDQMYANPAIQEAISVLQQRSHIRMLDCAEGELACGVVGKGRMQEVTAILEAIHTTLSQQDLSNRHVLITAGPTRENIDPVRYISNYSTGKMGYALARECLRRGAQVTLISGPTQMRIDDPFGKCQTLYVTSAEEMYQMALKYYPSCWAGILCAAVADFTPKSTAPEKIKKQPGQESMSLSLIKTHDIAATLGAAKKENQLLIGFALETQNEEKNALDKLISKNLDAIVLNSLRDAGAGFATDTNKVTLLTRSTKTNCPLASKETVATHIVDLLGQL